MAFGLQEIEYTHDNTEKIDREFQNLYQFAQDESFTVVRSTPVYSEMTESGFLIYQSTINGQPILFLRMGTSTYFIRPTLLK